MKRLLLLLTAFAFGLAASALPRPAAADGSLPDDWPALLNCADVDASGGVTAGDISAVVARFGTSVVKDGDGHFVPGPDYMLLYDVDGGGSVSAGDISTVVADFGDSCPLVETEVAAATLATMDYRDWSAAQDAGYIQGTQYVPSMGIHVTNNSYSTTFDETDVIGLIYKSGPGGVPDELIGLWYVVPVPQVCSVFGIDPATCQPVDEEPAGFDGSEDNTDMSSVQRGWHTHSGLCVWNEGGPDASVGENVPRWNCEGTGGTWFETYGWMVHLYNFIPNPDGRFMMWNFQNLP